MKLVVIVINNTEHLEDLNKTILTVTPDELVDDVLTVIEDVCGTFEESGTGLVFVLPVDTVRGIGTGLN